MKIIKFSICIFIALGTQAFAHEDSIEKCTRMQDLGVAAMTSRQGDGNINDIINRIRASDQSTQVQQLYINIVLAAFAAPIHDNERDRDIEIIDFGEMLVANCYDADHD